jgi:hypothetical protein
MIIRDGAADAAGFAGVELATYMSVTVGEHAENGEVRDVESDPARS